MEADVNHWIRRYSNAFTLYSILAEDFPGEEENPPVDRPAAGRHPVESLPMGSPGVVGRPPPEVGSPQAVTYQSGVSLLHLGLAEHLSDDLITSIQSGKFVELHKLLPWERADFEKEKIVTLDENKALVVVKPSHQKITNFGQWSQAWGIYHAAYIDKFPLISKALIKYAENIRTVAQVHSKDSDGWLLYDRHFRLKMAQNKCNEYRWDKLDYELLHSKVLIPAIGKQLSYGDTSEQADSTCDMQHGNMDESAQSDESSKSDESDKSDASDQSDKSDDSDQSDQSDDSDQSDKSEDSDQSDQSDDFYHRQTDRQTHRHTDSGDLSPTRTCVPYVLLATV